MTLSAPRNSSETSTINTPTSNIQHLTSSFKSWLVSKNYSYSTIRNYLADINNFFSFSLRSDIYDLTSIFSSDTVSSYLQTIKKNPAYPPAPPVRRKKKFSSIPRAFGIGKTLYENIGIDRIAQMLNTPEKYAEFFRRRFQNV